MIFRRAGNRSRYPISHQFVSGTPVGIGLHDAKVSDSRTTWRATRLGWTSFSNTVSRQIVPGSSQRVVRIHGLHYESTAHRYCRRGREDSNKKPGPSRLSQHVIEFRDWQVSGGVHRTPIPQSTVATNLSVGPRLNRPSNNSQRFGLRRGWLIRQAGSNASRAFRQWYGQ